MRCSVIVVSEQVVLEQYIFDSGQKLEEGLGFKPL